MRVTVTTLVTLLMITAYSFGQSHIETQPSKVLWLKVLKRGDDITILDQKTVSGNFKKNRKKQKLKALNKKVANHQLSEYCYRITDQKGSLLEEIFFSDPTTIHVGSYALGSKTNQEHIKNTASAIFTIKIPVSQNPAHINFVKVATAMHTPPPILNKNSMQTIAPAQTPQEVVMGSFDLGGL